MPLQRCTRLQEDTPRIAEQADRRELLNEEGSRLKVVGGETRPLGEGAQAIYVFAYAVHQPRLFCRRGRQRPRPIIADAEEGGSHRENGAVLPLLT